MMVRSGLNNFSKSHHCLANSLAHTSLSKISVSQDSGTVAHCLLQLIKCRPPPAMDDSPCFQADCYPFNDNNLFSSCHVKRIDNSINLVLLAQCKRFCPKLLSSFLSPLPGKILATSLGATIICSNLCNSCKRQT